MLTDCCESCEDYTSRVWVRILVVLACLFLFVLAYALYLTFGSAPLAAAVLWPLAAPYADDLAAMGGWE